jgi:diadenosine tetraphosphate (Ap4A) HIT family hydrolase
MCQINAAGANIIFQTRHWVTTLSRDQDYLGRSYVTLLDHCESLGELSAEQWQDFAVVVARIETGYQAAFEGNGPPFNWACLLNDAYKPSKSPEPLPHVHWHVRPRHRTPLTIAGVTFEDPDYASHYVKTHPNIVGQPVLDDIIARIQPHVQAAPSQVISGD